MKVLVIGSGAREHALVARLGIDPSVDAVVCAPGNPGIAALARCLPVQATESDALVTLARTRAVDLVVVGPEAPLALGLADRLRAEGIACFGPGAAAARLETSKAFAKDFMRRCRIPTADYVICSTEAEARSAVDYFGAPVVIKADGLAAGKGVVVATTRDAAMAAVDAAMVARAFGDAGSVLVVEQCVSGLEASLFAICDGRRALLAGTAQDHKRAFDDDQGPNTGGMGAFAPSPLLGPAERARVLREVVEPTLAGMRAEGHPFVGFLYVGLMMTDSGPKVIEYNVRFGDPEAQVVLPLLQGDLAQVLARAAQGDLREDDRLPAADEVAVGVVMASGGYPGPFTRGLPISGLDEVGSWADLQVFHAGTALHDGRFVTDGGRVLTVVARATTYAAAVARAYEGVGRIHFDHAHVRRDIGRRAVPFDGRG
jgi:phosphoribosylamine--glycine ligase